MKVELIHVTKNPLEVMTKAADQSYNTSHENYETIIKKIKDLGHETVFEHAHATFRITGISRACSHQLVRHRLLSLVQRSQRYVNEFNYEGIVPPSIQENTKALELFKNFLEIARITYKKLLREGIKKEDARFVLPNATSTSMVVTANFREWMHVIRLRSSNHAQWEIRNVVRKICQILAEKYPILFDDLIVFQCHNCKKYVKDVRFTPYETLCDRCYVKKKLEEPLTEEDLEKIKEGDDDES